MPRIRPSKAKALAIMGSAAAAAGTFAAIATTGLSAGAAPVTAAAYHAPAAEQAAAHIVKPVATRKHQPVAALHAKPQQPAARHDAVRTDAQLRPYRIYDSVTPADIPAHHAIATYVNGSYANSPAQVAGRKTVFWIDTNGSNPRADALDVEPGDATPTLAANWAAHKLAAQPHALARIYTMRSEWPAVKAAIANLPAHMQHQVRYWIADPTGVPHMVPGANATQWYWGAHFDISTAAGSF